MALDPTHSEEYFRRSVKKYLVDNLYTTDGVYIDFAKIYQTPTDGIGDEITEWIRFHFNGLSPEGNLYTGRVAAYMFVRRDSGTELARLRDKLWNYLVDLNMPDGLKRVPLYNDVWTQIGGMVVTTGFESKEEYADDDTLYKFVNIYFRYAIA